MMAPCVCLPAPTGISPSSLELVCAFELISPNAMECLLMLGGAYKTNAGVCTAALACVDLVAMLRHTAAMVSPQLARGGVSVALDVDLPSGRLWVMADERMVRRGAQLAL